MNAALEPRFDHLCAMSDERGTFEHARYAEPRVAHGYCTDDMARVLVVAAREPAPSAAVRDLAALSLGFLAEAQASDGRYRNRMSPQGVFEDRPTTEDCWGRSIWGLGTAVARLDDAGLRRSARAQFDRAITRRSRARRATAYAVIGAAEVLAVEPDHRGARAFLGENAPRVARPRGQGPSPWPEARLAYANAVLPEAMIAAGRALDDAAMLRSGIDLLGWLLEQETMDGHLSVTPAGGAAIGAPRPGFDQQPIEVAAIAEAAARAAEVNDDHRWPAAISAASAWFDGDNDAGAVMFEPATGGGFDGLRPEGPNLNQGCESTLALLATLQHARRSAVAPR